MERLELGNVCGVNLPQHPTAVESLGPGLAVVAALALAAALLAALLTAAGIAIEPTLLALLLGIATAQLWTPPTRCSPGITCAGRTLLRLGVVLSGWRLGLVPFATLGLGDLLGTAALVAATLLCGRWLARARGGDRDLGLLLAAGHAICGASAIVAADAAARNRARSVPAAIVLVTLAGTLVLLGLPPLAHTLGLSPATTGIWAGGCLHEVAQALAAGDALGDEGGAMATLFKLARVLFLLPLVLLLPRLQHRTAANQQPEANDRTPRPPLPWFVGAFALVGGLAAAGLVPDALVPALRTSQGTLMLLAMAALGLQAPLRELRTVGWRPLLLTALLTLFVGAAGLVLALAA
jgi:uncharacterized integral membrane protein (TIGR00698 family)